METYAEAKKGRDFLEGIQRVNTQHTYYEKKIVEEIPFANFANKVP